MHLNEQLRAPSMKMCTGKYLLFVFISYKNSVFPVVSFNWVETQKKQNYMNHTFLQSWDSYLLVLAEFKSIDLHEFLTNWMSSVKLRAKKASEFLIKFYQYSYMKSRFTREKRGGRNKWEILRWEGKKWGVDEYNFNLKARIIELLSLYESESNDTGYQGGIWPRKIG